MGKLAIGEKRPYVDLNSKAAERMPRMLSCRKPRGRRVSPVLAQHFCPNPLMVFGGGALFTGVRYIQVPRRANVEDTDRVLMTTMGGTVAVAGVVLLKDIMTFGYGPHFYIGAQLTRLEAKLAMEILLNGLRG